MNESVSDNDSEGYGEGNGNYNVVWLDKTLNEDTNKRRNKIAAKATGHQGKKRASTKTTQRIPVKTRPARPKKREMTAIQDGRKTQTRVARTDNGRGQRRTPATIRQRRSSNNTT